MAKGIRVNQLAKELNVESKAILQKLKDEGLGEKAPNHMSVLALGLAASVREWFEHAGGTAVETAAPVAVETATKTKATRSRKKKTDGAEAPPEETISTDAITATDTIAAPEAPTTDTSHKRPHKEKPHEEPAAPVMKEVPAVKETPVVEAPVVVAPVVIAPVTPVVAAPVAPVAPVAHKTTGPTPPMQRPTITLANRAGQTAPHVAERKPVIPAQKLGVPAPAQIKGPKVIREEKPDVVAAPKPRRPIGQGQDSAPPSFTQARTQGGRGVKVVDDDEEEMKKKAGAKGKPLSSRRRGPDGRRGEAEEKLREFTEADLIERRDRLNAAASYRTGFDTHLKKSSERGTHVQAKTAAERGGLVELEEPITIKTLSGAMGIKSNDIQGKLLRKGIAASINQTIDQAMAAEIALEYGLELKIAQKKTLEDVLLGEIALRQPKPEDLKARPPVVTILGHVDHGKTSLLDKIRNANVAAGEAGGITQHTAAWIVEVNGKRVTFIDTPGHQAFTSMRARGANMTDIVVLVVAAVEGVMPQTIESINHARAADVPIVVAMNKIDRADANPDMVLGQLAANGLNPVEWGGDTEVIRTSATTGQGIPELIEILDYQAELLELKANPSASALGTVIESRVDEGLGSVATVLVQDGTLKIGDIALSGAGYGRIRSLYNDRFEPITEAGPSVPVIVSGLNNLPSAGDSMFVLDDLDRARAVAEERATLSRQAQLGAQNRVTTADNLIATMKEGDVQTINLIIKGDVQGSVETLVNSVTGQNTQEVKVRVVHSGVGPVNESDVSLAMATKAKPTDNRVAIIGFNVVPDEQARALAEQNHIDVKTYRVIYEIFDDLKKALSGMLAPEEREKLHGHAEIRQVFKVSKVGNIAGCFVTDGHIQRGSKMRLIRNGAVITEGLSIETLKRLKDDVREVKAGLECGIKLAGYDDIKIGDVLEGYIKETFERTL